MQTCAVPPDAQTFLYAARKLLLVLHGAASIVLIGAGTHHAVRMVLLLRGHFRRLRLERTYGRVLAAAYVVVYALGALLYPTYRYHVRALYLDRHHPMVANVFDIKENLATIALPLAIAIGAMAGRLTSDPEDRHIVSLYAWMSLFVTGVVWFNVISGLLIVSYRSV